MANITKNLKKIEVGNPLINLELWSLYDIYQAANTDEELAKAYHTILNAVQGSDLAERLVYDMICFSTSQDENSLYFLMQKTLRDEC